jgi:hypothetical protein
MDYAHADPALLVYEVFLLALLLLKGSSREYFRAVGYMAANYRHLLHRRGKIQASRVVADRELMTSGPIFVRDRLVAHHLLKVGLAMLNLLFDAYWRLVLRWL